MVAFGVRFVLLDPGAAATLCCGIRLDSSPVPFRLQFVELFVFSAPPKAPAGESVYYSSFMLRARTWGGLASVQASGLNQFGALQAFDCAG